MAFEDSDVEEAGVEEAGPPPEESGNRIFLIVAGVLIGLLVLSLLCLGGYALIRVPQMRNAQNTQAAKVALQNTQAAGQATDIAMSVGATQTAKAQSTQNALATANAAKLFTPTPTRTQVLAAKPTSTQNGAAANAATATMAALQTRVASNNLTPTATLLPKAGLGDELIQVNVPAVGLVSVGVPAFVGLFVLLVGMAFVARWLRKR